MEQAEQIPDVGRMLQHHLHAVFFELADQLPDATTVDSDDHDSSGFFTLGDRE